MTLQALSNRTVYTNQWDAREANNMAHINLTRDADAVLVAPASADFVAKLLHGRADDLLSLMCLARPIERCPLLVAPAMNREMWAHPATQRNFAQLAADGATVLGPASGDQACGEIGDGRMLEPDELLAEVVAFFQPKLLAGRRVVVTAGPTFEPIDPVRGLTNRSSGKMGFAIARAAAEAGADVTLVSGPVALETPRRVRRIDVTTAVEMHAAVMAEVAQSDVFVATAAVADWRVAKVAGDKDQEDRGRRRSRVRSGREPRHPRRRRRAGEAAVLRRLRRRERQSARQREREAARKNVPLIVANLGPATFGQDDNTLTLIDANGARELPRAGKLVLARRLVAEIATRIAADPRAAGANRSPAPTA